jgi:hypothetical protein
MMKPKSVPAVKLRSRNRAGFTKGALAVKVCVRNSQNAEPLTTASMRISPEPNQSSSSPRSSRICNAPIATLNVAKPNQSSFPGCFVVSGKNAVIPRNARMPIGTLM